jgi:hypothetical protein
MLNGGEGALDPDETWTDEVLTEHLEREVWAEFHVDPYNREAPALGQSV